MRMMVPSLLFGLCLGISATATAAQAGPGRGYLGVALAQAPEGAPVKAMVARVDPEGPAASAGLRQGDLIRSVNGHPVADAHALQSYVFSQHPGAVVEMDVLRWTPSGFAPTRISVRLSSGPGDRPPAASSPAHQPEAAAPSTPPATHPESPVSGERADVRYVIYTDPAEHAFTVPAPAGWRVGGRMVRYGPISIAPFVQAMTPDGSIFVQLGDWHIKDYCDIPGWREGQLYTPGTSVEFVRRLQTAEQYAHSYALSFQQQLGCENPAFTESNPVDTPPRVTTLPQAQVETT
jgi:hypothetical protein